MPSLLDLPRELLQDVIQYTLQSPSPAPVAPKVVSSTDWIASGCSRRSSRLRGKDSEPSMLYFRRKPLHSLLLTCRQLNLEVQEVWRRVGSHGQCDLDVMVTNDGDFLVTWLTIPQGMFQLGGGWHLESLTMQLRFLDEHWVSTFCPQRYDRVKTLLERLILEDILHYGPEPRQPPEPRPRVRRGRGNAHRKAVGGKAPRKTRCNYIDAVRINVGPPPLSATKNNGACILAGIFGGSTFYSQRFGYGWRIDRHADGRVTGIGYMEHVQIRQFVVSIEAVFGITLNIVESEEDGSRSVILEGRVVLVRSGE